MEKFEVIICFTAATFKPSNGIWPVRSIFISNFKTFLWILFIRTLFQLCAQCYSKIGTSLLPHYRPVSVNYPARSTFKRTKITHSTYETLICHYCQTSLVVSDNYKTIFLNVMKSWSAIITFSISDHFGWHAPQTLIQK